MDFPEKKKAVICEIFALDCLWWTIRDSPLALLVANCFVRVLPYSELRALCLRLRGPALRYGTAAKQYAKPRHIVFNALGSRPL